MLGAKTTIIQQQKTIHRRLKQIGFHFSHTNVKKVGRGGIYISVCAKF
jgi:hypothetical protein